jgi:hypothetical protein
VLCVCACVCVCVLCVCVCVVCVCVCACVCVCVCVAPRPPTLHAHPHAHPQPTRTSTAPPPLPLPHTMTRVCKAQRTEPLILIEPRVTPRMPCVTVRHDLTACSSTPDGDRVAGHKHTSPQHVVCHQSGVHPSLTLWCYLIWCAAAVGVDVSACACVYARVCACVCCRELVQLEEQTAAERWPSSSLAF